MAKPEEHYIIAVDGVSGSGKSSTSKAVAKALGITYLDTGAMYRTLTWYCQQRGIPASDAKNVSSLAEQLQLKFQDDKIFADNEDVTLAIRDTKVSSEVSDYCAIPHVRELMVVKQREIAKQQSSILDGRDIGTVVFPKARFKFYLWASPTVRAERRTAELKAKGLPAVFDDVLRNLMERDNKDSNREHSPLKQARDAEMLDTSNMTFEDQVKKIVEKVKNC